MRCLFARGGGCDAPLPFDYLVSKEQKALSSDGERDYLVGIVAVPVLSTVAGVERVENTPPMSIDARQVDNPVQDDRWRERDTGTTPQVLVPEDCAIRTAERIGSICVDVQDVLCNGGRVVSREDKLVFPVQTSVVLLQGIEAPIARADIDILVVDDCSNIAAHGVPPTLCPFFGVQGTEIAFLRVVDRAACAGVEQMVGDDEWSAHNRLRIRLVEPVDLTVLCVDSIDTHLAHRVNCVLHKCLGREPSRIEGDATGHGAILFVQGIGAVIDDTVLHYRDCEIPKWYGDFPGIGRRSPTQRPISGIERVGISARARSTDIDDAIDHPRSSEEHMWRRRITHTGLISVFPGQRQLLAPAYRPIAGIHRVQLAVSGHVEGLLCPYLSDSSQDRNRWQVLTPVQSHLIRRGCRILVHCQNLLSLCLLLFIADSSALVLIHEFPQRTT